MAKEYCNITTDLTDVNERFEDYNKRFRMRQEFSLHSGNIYKQYGTGEVEQLFQNAIILTEVSAVASIDAVSKWYYDATNDIIYVRCSDDADPDTHTMERGFDWETLKTRVRNEQMEVLDSMLDARFPIPLPESRLYHTTGQYDIDIKRSCALLVNNWFALRAKDFKSAEKFLKQVTNEDGTGIVDLHNSGKRRFSFEVSPDELGHGNIEANSSNTGAGFIEIRGLFSGDTDEIWRVEMDLAGAVGTATFKYSRDKGSTWQKEDQATDNEWISLELGIQIRFFHRSGMFALGDKWDIYFTSEQDREDIVYHQIKVQRK
jgi:hypothetical protein